MLTRFRPSPALAVAVLALCVSIGGTAYATATIDGSSIVARSIGAGKLKLNTLTGAEINESTLGVVPTATNATNATNANHATNATSAVNATNALNAANAQNAVSANHATNASTVGENTVRTVLYAPSTESATPTEILHLGGLVLTATCANGDLDLTVTSTVDHAHLASELWVAAQGGAADGLHHSDFGPNSAIHLDSLTDGNPWGETSFTYTRNNGTIVNGQLSFDSSDLNVFQPGDGDIFDNAAKCLVSGFVLSTTAAP